MLLFENLLSAFPIALASIMGFSLLVLLIDIFSLIFFKK